MTVLSSKIGSGGYQPPESTVKVKALRAFVCPFYEDGAIVHRDVDEGAVVEIDQRIFNNLAKHKLVQKAPGRKRKEAETEDNESDLG